MAVGRVTQDSVNALSAGPRDSFLWDDKFPGFGLKVTPSGQKVFIYQYRMGGRGHKTRRVTIGKAGPLKAAAARSIAENYYARVRQGEDVAADARQRKRVAVELAFDKYVEDFADRVLRARWPKSWELTRQRLRNQAVGRDDNTEAGYLRDKPLPNVTADDIRTLLRKLDSQPAARRNLFAALSFLFNQSVKDGVLSASPLRSIEAPAALEDRDRVLNDDELRWFWSALQAEAEPYRGAIEDLLFMGQRRNESAGMPWSELNRDKREWHIPGKRTKNGFPNIVPLTANMIARLDKLAGSEKWPKSELVRKSREGTVLTGWSKLKRRLDASMAKAAKAAKADIEPWRLHDLRRTLATNMQRLGIQHEVVEHLLNHREKSRTGIAAVYQVHGFGPEKRKALERWEAELARIVRGEAVTVVAFTRPA